MAPQYTKNFPLFPLYFIAMSIIVALLAYHIGKHKARLEGMKKNLKRGCGCVVEGEDGNLRRLERGGEGQDEHEDDGDFDPAENLDDQSVERDVGDRVELSVFDTASEGETTLVNRVESKNELMTPG